MDQWRKKEHCCYFSSWLPQMKFIVMNGSVLARTERKRERASASDGWKSWKLPKIRTNDSRNTIYHRHTDMIQSNALKAHLFRHGSWSKPVAMFDDEYITYVCVSDCGIWGTASLLPLVRTYSLSHLQKWIILQSMELFLRSQRNSFISQVIW